MPSTACPTDQQLLAFQLGTLPAAEIDALADHLVICPRCEALARELDSACDPVVAALRRPSSAHSSLSPARAAERDPSAPENWPELPGYRVVGCLGRGGMGVVYEARQLRLNRPVALKRLGGGTDKELARARIEAEAVARLTHPNIVQVYEVVEQEGRAYLAMELVVGGSLAGVLDGKPQDPRASAGLVESLARAIHYAHERGVVHRDLKPANVLLAPAEPRPADAPRGWQGATPKIADFGVAKRLDGEAGATRDGDVIGTPAYMAPEQARGRAEEAGPAADVYGLGVILYELLTGRVPLQGPTPMDTLLLVLTGEPVPPRRLQPNVPRDLETVCLKSLQKEPARRYASAALLAEDLGRFRAGEPVRARPAPAWERLGKWARRRPAVAGLSAALALAAGLAFALVWLGWRRAEDRFAAEAAAKQAAQDRERQEELARRRLERLSAAMTLDQGIHLCAAGEVGHGLVWLARAVERAGRAGDPDLERAARLNLSGWQAYLIRPRAECRHPSWVWDVALSPDGRTLLTGCHDGTARLWDAATGRPRGEPLRHAHPVWAVAFAPDGKTFVTGAGDRNGKGEVRLWDAATARPLGAPLPHPARVSGVAFAPDGRTLLTVCPAEARLWNAADSRPLGEPLRHPGPRPGLRAAAFSPDGRTVATAGDDGTARLWDASTGRPRGEPLRGPGPVLTLCFSPDGRTLATGSWFGGAVLWDVATGRRRATLPHAGRVNAIAFSPGGEFLATAGVIEGIDPQAGRSHVLGGEARLWVAATGRPLGAPLPHGGPVWSVAFSPGGRVLLTGCEDGLARFWAVATGTLLGKPRPHNGGTVRAVAFSTDGATAVTASAGGTEAAHLWDVPPERGLGSLLFAEDEVPQLAFSPDGRLLVTGSRAPVARLWDVAGRRLLRSLPHEARVNTVAFRPDGQAFLTGSVGGDVRLWDRAGGLRYRFQTGGWLGSLAFSPDGRTGLAGCAADARGAGAWLWDAATGKNTRRVETGGTVGKALFSPDGQTFLTLGKGGARLYDAATTRLLRTWPGGEDVKTAAFDPNGARLLVVSGPDCFARFRDVPTGTVQSPPRFHPEGGIWNVAFGAEGRSVLVTERRVPTWRWDVATGKRLGPPLSGGMGYSVACAPRRKGGRPLLAVGGRDGRITLWEPPPPVGGSAEHVRLWVEVLTGLELADGELVRELTPQARQARRQHLRERGGPPPAAEGEPGGPR